MNPVQAVDAALLDALLAEAQAAPRLRKNRNFHDRAAHPCQRLLNAVLPGSYVRPHRHIQADKEEFLVILRGCLGLVFFDENGAITGSVKLEQGGAVSAVNIPTGVFHTAVALTPAVVFEAKGGPYAPHLPEEFAAFAPVEGSPQAGQYLQQLEAVFGDA
jgi:cupin fold WbuC family metalloprotein